MKKIYDQHFDDWRDKLVHGQLSREEAESLAEDPEYREWFVLLRAGAALKAPAYSEHDAWQDLKRRTRHPELQMTQLKKRRRLLLLSGLILIFLGAGLAWWFQGRDQVYSTGPEEQARFLLPDGTQVQLHVTSTLTWDPNRFSARARIIGFHGEAFFQQTNEQNLTLIHSNGELSARSASFNVRDRGTYFSITCYRGHVDAWAQGIHRRIAAGTQARWNGSRWETLPQPRSEKAPPWTAGRTQFIEVPLAEVVDELERIYDLTIDLNGRSEILFSGSLPNYNLRQAIDQLCRTAKLEADYFADHLVVLDTLPNRATN